MTQEADRAAKEAIVKQAVHLLGEHFPNVQVLVSYVEEGETDCIFFGSGDKFARVGLAREFILKDETYAVTGYRCRVEKEIEEEESGFSAPDLAD